MTHQEYAAIVAIALSVSSVVGWVFKAAHDRNIDAHNGILGRLAHRDASAHEQANSLQRIEIAVGGLAKKLDQFERDYWKRLAVGRPEV